MKQLDKRLRPAKVIGIILFVISISSFAGGLLGGLMFTMVMNNMGDVFVHNMLISGPMDWIFQNLPLLMFLMALFCIPLFFASRALFRFKEWGRVVCIIMLFMMMLLEILYGYAFLSVSFTPLPFRLMLVMIILVYLAALCVPVYFLMRRSTKEGIEDYNRQLHVA